MATWRLSNGNEELFARTTDEPKNNVPNDSSDNVATPSQVLKERLEVFATRRLSRSKRGGRNEIKLLVITDEQRARFGVI